MSKISTDNAGLCKLAVAFDLGDHVIGEVKCRVMVVKAKDAKWHVRATLGPMNVWGLREDRVWQYKGWADFDSPRDAVSAFNESQDNPKWHGLKETKNPDENGW